MHKSANAADWGEVSHAVRAEMQDRVISSTREIFRDASAIANSLWTPEREVVHFLVKANHSCGKIVKGCADIC
jgi:hypothetical protein